MSENTNLEPIVAAEESQAEAVETLVAPAEVAAPETTESAAVAEDAAPVVETPTPEAEESALETPSNTESSETEELRAKSAEQFQEAIGAVIHSAFEEFAAMLESAHFHELSRMMDELANLEISKITIRKIGKLKTRFDQAYQAELNNLKTKSIDDPATLHAKDQATEVSRNFNAALAKFNKRKADFENSQQAEKESNSAKKKALLDRLKEIVNGGDFNAIDKVREIQDAWKNIGQVLSADIEAFYQTYKLFLDQFYTGRTRLNELLEQDRKVNLQKKEQLISEVRALIPADLTQIDSKYWQEAGDKIKILHEQWKAVGPVPRAKSDEVWNAFKEETDRFYEFRRTYFETLDEQRALNAAKKQLILEQLQPFLSYESEDIEAWRETSKSVKALQEEWRSIGSAPNAINAQLTEQFNKGVNSFFEKRSQYFKELDSEKDDIVTKKQALLARAESLKDSEEWSMASEILKQLQKEWADAGPDTFKEALKLKKRFRKACDHFFRRYKTHIQDMRDSEEENLKLKNAIIDRLEAALELPEGAELEFSLDELKAEYDAIGKVPIKQKEKLYQRYRKAFDSVWRRFVGETRRDNRGGAGERGGDRNRNRNDRKGDRGGGGGGREGGNRDYQKYLADSSPETKMDGEERKLYKKIKSYEELISQYENNILFISQGKAGDRLRKEIEEKITVAKEMKDRLDAKMRQMAAEKAKATAAAAAAENAEAVEGGEVVEPTNTSVPEQSVSIDDIPDLESESGDEPQA